MALRIDAYLRLESLPGDRDVQNGFAARLHDPLWLLARQWQMGEHQGENASSPVRVEHGVTRTRIAALDAAGRFDPTVVPAEALVESERDDWWTMGRRVRVGERLASRPEVIAAQDLRFTDPPPPYEAFRGRVDGKAAWKARTLLGIPAAAFGQDAPSEDSAPAWNPRHLNYQTHFDSAERPLLVGDHHGGPMDWFSADGDPELALSPSASAPHVAPGVPAALQYPGAPHSRFWEIEDAAVDIGGYPPDTAHFATMLLVDLVYSHGDDWFLFPITAHAGHIVTIQSLKVTDAFGREYSSDDVQTGAPVYPGLHAPADFTLFKCAGLPDSALVLWPVAESPLESEPLERVQFGVDEHSNVLWALERVIDGRQVERRSVDADATHPSYPASRPVGDVSQRRYRYLPAVGLETRWHPYELDWAAPGELHYVQRGLADYSKQHPKPMPHAEADVLKDDTGDEPALHRIAAKALARGGLEIERRWQLARDMRGRPVLWIQRQRRTLRTPPARSLRFDVLEESAAD